MKPNTPKPIHGKLLILTGLAHLVIWLSPIAYGPQWIEFLREGLWNVMGHEFTLTSTFITNHAREGAFWAIMIVPFAILAGLMAHHIERRGEALPASFGWILLGCGIFGAVMMPLSGFDILVVPQAIFFLVRRKRAQARARAVAAAT